MKKETIDLTGIRRPYVMPQIRVIAVQTEQFMKASVGPHPTSQQEDFDADEDVDGGDFEFE